MNHEVMDLTQIHYPQHQGAWFWIKASIKLKDNTIFRSLSTWPIISQHSSGCSPHMEQGSENMCVCVWETGINAYVTTFPPHTYIHPSLCCRHAYTCNAHHTRKCARWHTHTFFLKRRHTYMHIHICMYICMHVLHMGFRMCKSQWTSQLNNMGGPLWII